MRRTEISLGVGGAWKPKNFLQEINFPDVRRSNNGGGGWGERKNAKKTRKNFSRLVGFELPHSNDEIKRVTLDHSAIAAAMKACRK